jgi:hypothetical protein
VLRVYGPAVLAYLGAVSLGFLGLYCSGVAGPADGLEVVQVEKQVVLAFVGFDVVNDGGSRVGASSL